MSWWLEACKVPSAEMKQQAEERQSQLTKPTGSLAALENVAVQLASLQNNPKPQLEHPWITIFAGDHGVMAENVSAYPQAVTRQMLQNFATGGACISVIAKEYAATLQVIDCGTVGDAYEYQGVERHCIATKEQAKTLQNKLAMTEEQCAPSYGFRTDVFKALCAVGGLEIAAMTGAYIRCAQVGLAVIVDGFISSVAALVAVQLNPAVRQWMLFGHQSAEYGHLRILQELNADPLLKLNLRLGEGSGAGASLGVIKLACSLHNNMATFAEAAVIGEKV
ncbi:hypothetical protein FQR65_LT19340 [Abscondita terminalis]|nr:hypothetical protein FQR65_LT19340 [Abscondita terminalis]